MISILRKTTQDSKVVSANHGRDLVLATADNGVDVYVNICTRVRLSMYALVLFKACANYRVMVARMCTTHITRVCNIEYFR